MSAGTARKPAQMLHVTRWEVLGYVPNIIGYARGFLLWIAFYVAPSRPEQAFWLLLTNLVLDGVDGAVARRLKQTSAFGAFLDVLLDNVTRGLLWINGAASPILGLLMHSLEMTTFVCTHKAGGRAWKEGCFMSAPSWVQSVMSRNFKQPLGSFMIVGLMGLPLYNWVLRHLPGSWLCHWSIGLFLSLGRGLGLAIELWILGCYMQELLDEDTGCQPGNGCKAFSGVVESPASPSAVATQQGQAKLD